MCNLTSSHPLPTASVSASASTTTLERFGVLLAQKRTSGVVNGSEEHERMQGNNNNNNNDNDNNNKWGNSKRN